MAGGVEFGDAHHEAGTSSQRPWLRSTKASSLVAATSPVTSPAIDGEQSTAR